MKKIISYLVYVFVILLPLINFAQNSEQNQYSNSITIEELKDHMYYLASDELEGRMTGSKGFDIAANILTYTKLQTM